MTHFLFYDHNETQSECAHRLCVSCTWERRARVEKMNNCIDINLQRTRGRFLLSNLIKINNSILVLFKVRALFPLQKLKHQLHSVLPRLTHPKKITLTCLWFYCL